MTYRHMITLVHQHHDGELVTVRHAEFTEADPVMLECVLDAAWTAFKERRSDQALRLIGEVTVPASSVWLVAVLPSCVRSPKVGPRVVGLKGEVVVDA